MYRSVLLAMALAIDWQRARGGAGARALFMPLWCKVVQGCRHCGHPATLQLCRQGRSRRR